MSDRPDSTDLRGRAGSFGVRATEAQSTRHVLLVRPANFSGNVQTASSNPFQKRAPVGCHEGLQAAAVAEFDGLVEALTDKGVRVVVFDDLPEPVTPDAIFPNNWVSFHADGTAVLYPMLAPNRRLERRMDILESLVGQYEFRIERVVDLTFAEQQGRFLEGTGSLVLDRPNRIAYACRSPRTDEVMLREFALRLGYEVICFSATDEDGVPVYHTNVMLTVGRRFAAVCSAAISGVERRRVLESLQSTGHDIVDLTRLQMACFAGNALELQGGGQSALLLASESAYGSLGPEQRSAFAALDLEVVTVPLPTIERVGGGSARCMVAEIHLPHARG